MYSLKNEGNIHLVHEHNNSHFKDNSCSAVIMKQLKALVVFKAGFCIELHYNVHKCTINRLNKMHHAYIT